MDLVGKRCLFKQKRIIMGNPIREFKIIELTEHHIKFQWLTGSVQWLALKDFHEDYELLEVLKDA